jgi:FAD dependent oxidoreductase TIGR03364
MGITNHRDIAIVGAGIVGLAHALAAAKRGHKVTVFERSQATIGASIRNFGMIWPVGQPAGKLLARALKSRAIWTEVSPLAGIELDQCGSLHLAYREDELAVIEEFVSSNSNKDSNYNIELLSAAQVSQKTPAAITEGLLGALWSSTEMTVDPRQAIAKLPEFLWKEYGVEFKFGTAVVDISHPKLITATGETMQAKQILVCSGADFESLYPSIFAATDITKVKLQMMRTKPQPNNWRIGPSLCGGLTLTHYGSFAHCPSLDQLKKRIELETPHFPRWGIHVMMSQNYLGELIIGDSHEYGLNPDPFDQDLINQYILNHLKGFAQVPDLTIAQTWHGVYPKLPGKTELVLQLENGVTIINALSGAGMTLSFGLAEEIFTKIEASS